MQNGVYIIWILGYLLQNQQNTASFTKDQLATDNDQLFSIAVCHFMLEETIVGVTLDPEKMDSLMKKWRYKIYLISINLFLVIKFTFKFLIFIKNAYGD